MPPRGQGIGFSLLTRIRVAPTDIIGFIPTDFYSRVWVRVRVSSCGFFRFGFLFVDSSGVSQGQNYMPWWANFATAGPILIKLRSRYMFFGSGNPFLALPKLYSGHERKAAGFYVSENRTFEFWSPLGTPPKVAAKIFFGEKLVKTQT